MSELNNAEKVATLRDVADDLGADFRESYSGRGMYGDRCVGIVHDSATEVIEEASARGIRGASTDSMGLSVIVYWQAIKPEEE